jgi:hypothetical protein
MPAITSFSLSHFSVSSAGVGGFGRADSGRFMTFGFNEYPPETVEVYIIDFGISVGFEGFEALFSIWFIIAKAAFIPIILYPPFSGCI